MYLASGSTSALTSALTITNSTVANGLYIGSVNITPTITGNTFTNVDSSPIHAGANIIGSILNNNTVTGMTSAGKIEVIGEQVKQDATWKKWAAPYVVTSDPVSVYKDTTGPATLTIDPGVTVKFASTSGLQIGSGASQGALVAGKPAADRVTFTRSGTSGSWGSITFNDGTVDGTTALVNVDIQYSSCVSMTSANPTLQNVAIACDGAYGIILSSSSPVINGGSLTNTKSTGQGIYISGYSSPAISNYSVSIVNTAGKYGVYSVSSVTAFSLANSTIANGLYLLYASITPTITGNTFTNADSSPIHAGANIIGSILNNNTVTGMTSAGKIEVVGEQVKQNAQWKKWAAPYVVVSDMVNVYKDTTSAATLTIDPGVVVKFGTNTSLQVGSGTSRGVLVAKGTSGDKIIFTSSQASPAPGNWNGIKLNGDASSASVLEQAVIEYAGTGLNYNNANLAISASAPLIRNCTIRNSGGSGVYIASATNWPVIIDSEITGNKWGVYSISSNPYVTNSKITGNTTYGLYNATATVDVDARGNWWGAAAGPSHTSNPSGTGDKVSDKVLYNPWLGQAPGTGFAITEAKALPASLNPEGDYISFTALISASANWTITITDSVNAVVKTFAGTGATINQKWYGENDQAAKVADGPYYYKIEATNPATSETASAPQGMLVVSRLIPIAIIKSPLDNEQFTGGTTINITGTASDSTDFKNYKLEYGVGENPASWTNLKTVTTPITSGLIYALNTTTLTNSVYTLRLTVTDNAGNIATETARVRLSWIQNVAATEGYISPNGDGVKDSTQITATFNQQANWTLTFKNSAGAAVRTYSGTGSSMAQTWDGKDEAGQVVTDGSYTYRIDAMGGFVTGTIVVDTTGPTALITAPISSAALWNTVQIAGTASDINFDNYKVEYGPGSGSGPWTLISSATSSVTSGTLATWTTNDQTNTVLLQNGGYSLKLTSTDKAGNSTVTTLPVNVDNLVLSGVSINSHSLDTLAAQTNIISYGINGAGTVTLKIVPEKQGPAGSPIYQTSQTVAAAGSSSFTWNGKDSTGKVVPDEAYLYVLDASDGTRTDIYSPSPATGTGSITCTQESTYNPYKNDPLTISYTVTQPERVDITINWGTSPFKVLDGVPRLPGNYTFDWDGRNPAGKILAAGGKAECAVASLLRENYIVTSGDAIKITGFTTDPYEMQLSYGEFTRIKYSIDRDANVTVKLISPTGSTTTLVNNEYRTTGAHELEWNGLDSLDATGKKFITPGEGDYIVSIQAVNPTTGTSTTVRGSLKIGY